MAASFAAGRLKLITGLSTLAVCGAASAVVGLDPKPAGAPLTPPVSGGGGGTAMVIPPSCGSVQTKPAPQLSAAAQQALVKIRAAKGDKTAIRGILAGLSASDRQAVVGYLQNRGRRRGAGASCSPAPSSSGGGPSITPSTGTGGPAAPVVISSVS